MLLHLKIIVTTICNIICVATAFTSSPFSATTTFSMAKGNGETTTTKTQTAENSFIEPPKEDSKSQFGRQEYWNTVYNTEKEYTWYSPWNDLEPFFNQVLEETLKKKNIHDANVLLPGIGNDKSMVEMYDDGYKYMTAFDYAPEGVECAKEFFGPGRLRRVSSDNESNDVCEEKEEEGVNLDVADARNLPYKDDTFDAVLEKGTLDAIYLSGGSDKILAAKHLGMAIQELARVVKQGGIVFSVTAACVDAIQLAFEQEVERGVWEQVRDGSLYITDDGYASNNVDATMLVYKKL